MQWTGNKWWWGLIQFGYAIGISQWLKQSAARTDGCKELGMMPILQFGR